MRAVLIALIAGSCLVAACSKDSALAPTGVSPAEVVKSAAAPTSVSVTFPSEGSGPIAAAEFPPRNEPFAFRQDLEVKYRDGLRRGATSTFVDLEGDIVWIQEYLRYRVSACGHGESEAKVFTQIDGGGVQPACSGAASFPPRNEPFAFRQDLEAKYRDGLRRGPTSTFVDLEGDIVWILEYLRYRVSSCSHADAEAKVFAQIDGGGVPADCTPLPSGTFTGTTSQGKSISITVASNRITAITFGGTVTGAGCTSDFTQTTTGLSQTITGGSFSFSRTGSVGQTGFSISGTFTSATQANGSITMTTTSIPGVPSCIGTTTATWSVTKSG